MYIIVAGMGQVGLQIVETLLLEGHNLAVIEDDPKRIGVIENMDLLSVEGNAASLSVLIKAGINSADLFIAATGSDEVNIISCVIAKSKGCRTIAQINSQDYIPENTTAGKLDLFGIDLAICPDLVTATHMSKMLLLPSLVDSEEVRRDGVMIISFTLMPGCRAVGNKTEGVAVPNGATIAAISRMGVVVQPELSGTLREDDKVYVIIDSKSKIKPVEKAFGLESGTSDVVGEQLETGLEKVMIVGANETGIRLAKILESTRHVVIFDEDERACQYAAGQLGSTLVINSSGTDDKALRDEGVQDVGAFVATTRSSEYNMLSCLLARRLGARKTMAVVEDPELRPLFEQIGVSVTISPRLTTANHMLKHVPRGATSTIAALPSTDSRVLEIRVTKGLSVVGREFGKLKLPSNSFIGAVIRERKVLIPTRYDVVRNGDRLILFVGAESLRRVEKMFMKGHKHR